MLEARSWGFAQKVAELTPCRRAARRAALPLCEGENKAAHFVGSFSPSQRGRRERSERGGGSATMPAIHSCSLQEKFELGFQFVLNFYRSPCQLHRLDQETALLESICAHSSVG